MNGSFDWLPDEIERHIIDPSVHIADRNLRFKLESGHLALHHTLILCGEQREQSHEYDHHRFDRISHGTYLVRPRPGFHVYSDAPAVVQLPHLPFPAGPLWLALA